MHISIYGSPHGSCSSDGSASDDNGCEAAQSGAAPASEAIQADSRAQPKDAQPQQRFATIAISEELAQRSAVLHTCLEAGTDSITVPFSQAAADAWAASSAARDMGAEQLLEMCRLCHFLRSSAKPYAAAFCARLPERFRLNRRQGLLWLLAAPVRLLGARPAAPSAEAALLMEQHPDIVQSVLQHHALARQRMPAADKLARMPEAAHAAMCRRTAEIHGHKCTLSAADAACPQVLQLLPQLTHVRHVALRLPREWSDYAALLPPAQLAARVAAARQISALTLQFESVRAGMMTADALAPTLHQRCAVRALLAAPVHPLLTRLDLSRTQLGSDGVPSLAAALRNLPTLRALNVSHCGLGISGAQLLAPALASVQQLTQLQIAGNAIQRTGLAVLLRNLPCIQSLNLANNKLGNSGVAALMRAERCTQLQQLCLSDNGVTEHGAQYLLPLLHRCAALQALQLQHHALSALSAARITAHAVLHMQQLTRVDLECKRAHTHSIQLSNNYSDICSEGGLPRLRHLSLRIVDGPAASEDGSDGHADSAANAQLPYLWQHVISDGALPVLTALHLHSCEAPDTEMLAQMPALQELRLMHCTVAEPSQNPHPGCGAPSVRATRMPALTKLVVESNHTLHSSSIDAPWLHRHISLTHSLRELEVSSVKGLASHGDRKHASMLQMWLHATSLTRLQLAGVGERHSSAMDEVAFADAFDVLRALSLPWVTQLPITSLSLRDTLSHVPDWRLTRFCLDSCEHFARMLAALPHLSQLDVRGDVSAKKLSALKRAVAQANRTGTLYVMYSQGEALAQHKRERGARRTRRR